MKYVSFEIAKKLRELGYNKTCLFSYLNDWGNHTVKLCTPIQLSRPTDGLNNEELALYGGAHWEYIAAPTQEETMDWLRNTHKLHIYAFHTSTWEGTEWCYEIEKMDSDWTFSKHHGLKYEECIEEAIRYAIENYVKIEITPTILTGNGFIEDYDELLELTFFTTEDKRVGLFESEYNDGKKWTCHVDNEDMDSIGNCRLNYVSELQSFLDACAYSKTLIY